MDSLQRVGGNLESHRRPSGRRAVLLPYEVDLCEQLGITADEYWEFLANAHDFVKERPEAYAGIPDVRNNVVAILVNIVIGIALTAVSALLAPKPKAPTQSNRERLGTLDIDGSQGRSRYTKASNFDSVQSLANLGEIIPLVFADKSNKAGGIRIDTQLLFSQMITAGTTQTLLAVMMLGAGKLLEKPDYKGYAICDLMLRDFSAYKQQLFSNVGDRGNNRLKDGTNGDQYDETKMVVPSDNSDAFSIYWPPNNSGFEPHFSGTRTPSTKTSFGLFNPIPNGFRYLVPYELVLVPSGDIEDLDLEEQAEDSTTKRDKVMRYFSREGGLTSVNNEGEVSYYLSADRIKTNGFLPWGTADILQAQDETRTTIDEIIQEGQEYMLGSCRAICTDRPDKQFAPEDDDALRYKFQVLDNVPGSNGAPPVACSESELNIQVVGFRKGQNDLEEQAAGPWDRGCVQELAVASLSNSRACDATEIGIKSEVWRQCQNTANFNAHPDGDTIDRYQEANSNINLGTITKYTKRYSFFKIFARKANAAKWRDINDGRVFAVRGVSPEYIFNTLFIKHEEGQHEFEIVPVPGSEFYSDAQRSSIYVHLLDGRPLSKGVEASKTSEIEGYRIYYTGVQETLTLQDVTNPEWVFNYIDQNSDRVNNTGPITKLGSYDNGKAIPQVKSPKKSLGVKWSTNDDDRSMVTQDRDTELYTFYWDGKVQGTDIPKDFINTIGSGGRDIQYTTEQLMRPMEPDKWGDEEIKYDLFDAKGQLKENDRSGVIYQNGLYSYWWNGENPINTARDDAGWIENSSGLRRYQRVGGKIPGGKKQILLQEGLLNVAERDNEGRIKRVNTGYVINTEKNEYQFWRSGALIGLANGSNVNSFREGDGTIWKKSSKVQDASGGESNLEKRPPSVDWSQNIIKNAVKNGSLWSGVPGGSFRLFWDGVELGSISNETFELNSGGWIYRCRPNQNNVSNGQINGKWFSVYGIERFQGGPKRYEVWSIDKLQEVIQPDSWKIERERLEEGSNGRWKIEKFERGELVDVEGTKSTKVLKEGSEDSARVQVTRYKAQNEEDDAYSWRITNGGNGYRAGTTGEIVGTPINKVKITEVRPKREDLGEPDVSNNTDVNERFWDFTRAGTNYSPLNAICDYYINNTDTSSHANSPEHQIVFCNELIEQFDPNAEQDGSDSPIPKYSRLALAGIKLLNSKEWTSFNSLSAYIKHGHMVKRLFVRSEPSKAVDGEGATNLFPEIAYHLLTDTRYGAGKLIGEASVDRGAMREAARFCLANGFYWDGVITEGQNLREFIFENAAFILLDFTIKGRKWAVFPSVPYGSDYTIKNDKKPEIKALFTDGNMRNMTVSFLSPEERQPFQGVCIFRKEKTNAFPELRSMTMRLKSGSENDPIEKFDCSGFMTSENHARMFLRYALKVRQLVDHGIKFDTTPQSAMNMEPGEYFRVASKSTHTDRFTSGSVDFEGNITSSQTYGEGVSITVVYWKPGSTDLSEITTTVTGNKVTQSALFGCLFCEKTESSESRVYKCESLSYAEDGLVEVTGSSTPLNDRGELSLLDWDVNDAFIEEVY